MSLIVFHLFFVLFFSMADCFYDGGQHAFDTDHRRSTLASGFKRMTRIDIHDNDFSSMYTAKSGTPLIHKMRGTPDELSDLTMSITPRLRTTVPLNSLHQEDSNHLREDSSVFCDKYNMRQCLKYLDQVRFLLLC